MKVSPIGKSSHFCGRQRKRERKRKTNKNEEKEELHVAMIGRTEGEQASKFVACSMIRYCSRGRE